MREWPDPGPRQMDMTATQRLDALYAWLADVPTPACERILATALEHAESPYFERIAELLFGRDTEAAWAGLIGNYPRLRPAATQRLRADAARFRAGLAHALRARTATARANALAVLREHPCSAVSYLLPDVLRDTSEEVRGAAALALRRVAEAVLDGEALEEWDDRRRDAHHSARTEVAKAAWEALRTFDLHYRLEAVEVALWFAQDFPDPLWASLDNPRAHGSYVVRRHLDSWNSPRLARFLLEALARPTWRSSAQQLLREWHKPPEIGAMLRNTDALANPEIRRRLGLIKPVRWFDDLGNDLQLLPPALRKRAPQWVCHLGYTPDRRLTLLSNWLGSADASLRQHAGYALAALDATEALAHIANAAGRTDALATFARWYLAGKQAAHTEPANQPRLSAEQFTWLWRECQGRAPHDDDELIQNFRGNLPAWRHHVLERLHSEDPKDRMLALRIISTPQHAADFRAEFESLLNDPVDAIQRIAYSAFAALESVADRPRNDEPPPEQPPAKQEDEPADAESETPIPQAAPPTESPSPQAAAAHEDGSPPVGGTPGLSE